MPPKKRQKLNYSGKKKCHTAKAQLIVTDKGEILHIDCTLRQQHDFSLFKISRRNLSAAGEILADSGYQGIGKWFSQASVPIKSSKNHPLTHEEKAFNRALSSRRIMVENVFAKLKTFKCLACRYRNHLKRLGLRLNLIAGIVDYERFS